MMMFTLAGVAPLRAQAAHRSEMVSQLLFGELCETIEQEGDFIKVKCRYDGYEGWVQGSQLAPVEPGLFDEVKVVRRTSTNQVRVDGATVQLSPGAELYFRAEARNQAHYDSLNLGRHLVQYPADIINQHVWTGTTASAIIDAAMQFLGTPYLWGGKSIWGIDCSGFVQMSFKLMGMFVPRDAWQQAEGGDLVGFLQEAQPGDLAFFDNAEGRITHVGIMLNEHEILHASGMVRIDPIDNYGIMHGQSGKRTHNLRMIKRYF